MTPVSIILNRDYSCLTAFKTRLMIFVKGKMAVCYTVLFFILPRHKRSFCFKHVFPILEFKNYGFEYIKDTKNVSTVNTKKYIFNTIILLQKKDIFSHPLLDLKMSGRHFWVARTCKRFWAFLTVKFRSSEILTVRTSTIDSFWDTRRSNFLVATFWHKLFDLLSTIFVAENDSNPARKIWHKIDNFSKCNVWQENLLVWRISL